MKKRITSRQTATELINSISSHVKKSKLAEETLKQVASETSALARFLGCSKTEAVLFAVVYRMSVDLSDINWKDIAQYLGCDNLVLFSGKELVILNKMQEAGYIFMNRNRHSRSEISVRPKVFEAISNNNNEELQLVCFNTMQEVVEYADSLFRKCIEGDMDTDELVSEIKLLRRSRHQVDFFERLDKLKLSDSKQVILLLAICCARFYRTDGINYDPFINDIFGSLPVAELMRLRKSISSGTSILLKNKWASREGQKFSLTDLGARLFLDAAEALPGQENTEVELKLSLCTHIPHQRLRAKKLYYNPEESKQLQQLEELLSEKNFDHVSKQLQERGLSNAFTTLLHGKPGCGKTEFVYQLALATGRDILMVNISEVKGKFVGESEKGTRAIFDEYRQACEQLPVKPILLFNESDSLINKRVEVTDAVSLMQNSMQNILLQELEDLDGILFATSNLVDNLDTAFERRFLFKVRFDQPSAAARQAIWLDKLPELAPGDAQQLAQKFELSGGQVDNICKKYLISHLLLSSQPTSQAIEALCQEELLQKAPMQKIGF